MCLSRDSSETDQLLHRVRDGDRGALDQLLQQHRAWLRQVVEARIEPGLRRRVDRSDVIQETLLVASRRIEDFLARRPTSFRLWLRRKALEQLTDLRRRHRAQKRDADRDIAISDASSLAIARSLMAGSPSEALRRDERIEQLRRALMGLSEADREVLVLRNAEELSNAEVAELLQLSTEAASKRYGRALRRLSGKLAELGFSHGG